MVGGTILGLVVLGCIRKQAEQVLSSKSVSNIPPLLPFVSAPFSRFQPCLFPVLTSSSDLEA